MRRYSIGLPVALVLAGCTPPQTELPGPTLPWWLVFAILGGVSIYALIRSGK